MHIGTRPATHDDAGTVAGLTHALIVELASGAGLEVGAPDQPAWPRTLDFYRRQGFTEVRPRLKWLIVPAE